MRPRFLADANLNREIPDGLLRREPAIDFQIDVSGLRGVPDPEVLAVAATRGRILVTHDIATMPVHFGRFIMDRESAGVLIVRQKVAVGIAITELLMVWEASDAAEWRNMLMYLPLS